LRPWVGRPVVDKTGLLGFYRLTMDFDIIAARRGQVPDAIAADGAASIFTAVQEQLGLKLRPSRGIGTRLIIDRIDRPTPN
jgi:uncharacterized protein (TIGR03435 family)